MEGGNGAKIQASHGCKPVGVSAANVITLYHAHVHPAHPTHLSYLFSQPEIYRTLKLAIYWMSNCYIQFSDFNRFQAISI